MKHRDYRAIGHTFSFWRERNHEIDILVERGHGPILAIECKSGRADIRTPTVHVFKKQFPHVPLIVASLLDKHPRRLENGVDVLPWAEAIQRYQSL
jgi:predicted RecB family endonuclease